MTTILEEISNYRTLINEDLNTEPKPDLSASIYSTTSELTSDESVDDKPKEVSIKDQYEKLNKKYEKAKKDLYSFMKENSKKKQVVKSKEI
jgi:Cft2 family RNA processing exonuclease